MNRIIFRFDANIAIGRGHMSRSLSLAQMLKEHFEVAFISMKNSGDFCSSIKHEFLHIYINSDYEIANYLRVNDILVLDGYNFNEQWFKKIKSHVHSIVVIDDFGLVPDYADMIINHTPGITSAEITGSRTAQLCLGLDYCIVSPELFELRKKIKNNYYINGILVCFGGVDPLSLCEEFVKELLEQGFNDQIVAVGRLSKNLTRFPNVLNLQNIDSLELGRRMISSRVSVLSSSVVAFEAAALGCSIFAIYYTSNQTANYRGLTKLGLVEGGGYIKSKEEVRPAVNKIVSLYYDDIAIKNLRKHTLSLIDGQSNKRIISSFMSLINSI